MSLITHHFKLSHHSFCYQKVVNRCRCHFTHGSFKLHKKIWLLFRWRLRLWMEILDRVHVKVSTKMPNWGGRNSSPRSVNDILKSKRSSRSYPVSEAGCPGAQRQPCPSLLIARHTPRSGAWAGHGGGTPDLRGWSECPLVVGGGHTGTTDWTVHESSRDFQRCWTIFFFYSGDSKYLHQFSLLRSLNVALI